MAASTWTSNDSKPGRGRSRKRQLAKSKPVPKARNNGVRFQQLSTKDIIRKRAKMAKAAADAANAGGYNWPKLKDFFGTNLGIPPIWDNWNLN